MKNAFNIEDLFTEQNIYFAKPDEPIINPPPRDDTDEDESGDSTRPRPKPTNN